MNISSMDITSQRNSTTERDACIIDMLVEVKGMVSNFSHKYRMDFDDCYQHASLLMLQAYPKIPDGYNVQAYLNVVVRNGLNVLLRRHIDYNSLEISLDMTRTEDGAVLADMLQAPDESRAKAEIQRMDHVTEVVHSALSQCRIEEQEYACKAFELHAYKPVPPTNHPLLSYNCKKDKPRRTDSMRLSIKHMLSRNTQVQALIQREACVL